MTTVNSNETWRQHYVPQFYLRCWANRDGKLWHTRMESGRFLSSQTTPKATAYEPNLYTASTGIAWQSQPPKDLIEKQVMGPVDDAGAAALARLSTFSEEPLPDPMRRAWAQFLVASFHRDPYLLSWGDRRATELAQDVLNDMRARFGNTPEERTRLDEALEPINFPEMARCLVRTTMAEQIRSDVAVERVLSMRWYTARVAGHELITSDRPLLVNLGRPSPAELMSIAIGPQLLFIATPAWSGESEHEISDLTTCLTAYHNLLLLEAQPRRVYSRNPLQDTPQCRLRTIVETRLRLIETAAG